MTTEAVHEAKVAEGAQAASAAAEDEVAEPPRKRLLLVLSEGEDEKEAPPGTVSECLYFFSFASGRIPFNILCQFGPILRTKCQMVRQSLRGRRLLWRPLQSQYRLPRSSPHWS